MQGARVLHGDQPVALQAEFRHPHQHGEKVVIERRRIGAEEFYILTNVSFIYKDFGLPTQEKLEFLNYKDTKEYLEKGTFGEGSMAPKIVAAMKFVENGGIKSIITEASKLEDKRYGSKITMEYEM